MHSDLPTIAIGISIASIVVNALTIALQVYINRLNRRIEARRAGNICA